MNSNKIVQLLNPTSNQDAATKSYVDTKTTDMATTSSVSTAISTALGANGTQENRPTVQRGDTTNETHYLTYINGSDIPGDGSSKRALMRCDGGLTYNPNTNTLTADRFNGNCLGTAVAINAPTNSSTYIATNGSTRMFVDTAGFVGIGTTSPQNKLDIDAGSSGGIRISSTGATSIYMKSTTNNNNRPELELGTDDNNSYIMTRYDTPVRFITNSVERMRITSGGNVGIGTTSPEYPLQVMGSNNPLLGVSQMTDGGSFRSGGPYNWPISIRSEKGLRVGGDIVWNSDKRIKKNVKDIDGNTALLQIRQIRPKIYNYIDYSTKGTADVYGFIAQDVKDIILHSTMCSKDYIPNFYCKGNIRAIDASNNIYEISSENDLSFEKVIDDSGNEVIFHKVKIYGYDNTEYFCCVTHLNNLKNIVVTLEKEFNFSNKQEKYNKIFIYGQQIYDFHSLEKNAIWTVATAALQEVDRQQQADKARIAELEATVATQQSLINDILERLKALERA